MRVVRGFLDLERLEGTSRVSIGNFDGVHRGHRAVIGSAVEAARRHGVQAVVCTFDPHTRVVVDPRHEPDLLQTLQQRLAAIEELGVDLTVVIPFGEETARVEAETFVQRFLRGILRAGGVHVSQGFRFGRGGAGDVELLRRLAGVHDFDLEVVPPVVHEGEPVSSTRVRDRLREGDVVGAAALLGRPFALAGRVVEGAGRGRELSTPTANLDFDNGCVPAAGVYVTQARLDGDVYPSVSNVGFRPTFGGDEDLTVEAHLLDRPQQPDLYGKEMELAFLRRLRDEKTFESPETLKAQIRQDIQRAQAFFGSASTP